MLEVNIIKYTMGFFSFFNVVENGDWYTVGAISKYLNKTAQKIWAVIIASNYHTPSVLFSIADIIISLLHNNAFTSYGNPSFPLNYIPTP